MFFLPRLILLASKTAPLFYATPTKGPVVGETESQAVTRLLTNYRRNVPPKKPNGPVDVQLSLAVRAVANVDQIESTILANVWFRQSWRDPRLAWNPTKNNNGTHEFQGRMMTYATHPERTDAIWVPDLTLYNTAEKPLGGLEHTHAIVLEDGLVVWSRPGVVTLICEFVLDDFPFDTQVCHMKMGSWAYDADSLRILNGRVSVGLPPARGESDGGAGGGESDGDAGGGSASSSSDVPPFPGGALDFFQLAHNQEWEVVQDPDHHVIERVLYGCCPFPFEHWTAFLTLKRRHGFYVNTFLVPASAIAFTILCAALIPWGLGERISYTTTMTLTLTVFFLIVSEHLPKTQKTPLLSRIFSFLIYGSLIFLLFVIGSTKYSQCAASQKEDRQKKAEENDRRRMTLGLEQLGERLSSSSAARRSSSMKKMSGKLKNSFSRGLSAASRQFAFARGRSCARSDAKVKSVDSPTASRGRGETFETASPEKGRATIYFQTPGGKPGAV